MPQILVVDDEEMILVMLARLFASRGYKVSAARNGYEALAQVRSGRPDLVLSDLKMPGLNGVSLCREIRKLEPGIPFVGMSGYALEKSSDGEDFDAFVSKPFQIEALLQLVESLIEEKTFD
ncbi:MAG: response regulator [bacterium]|nr:response regulator [bacterium]